MKTILFILLLSFITHINFAYTKLNYKDEHIKEYVRTLSKQYTDIYKLHKDLVKYAKNDLEKILYFHHYIAINHIFVENYKLLYNSNGLLFNNCYEKKSIYNMIGNCSTFSILFNELCNLSNIESYIIQNIEHNYNVIKFNGKYYLFDSMNNIKHLLPNEIKKNDIYYKTKDKSVVVKNYAYCTKISIKEMSFYNNFFN